MKTVSLDDEAYRLLEGAKFSPRESFSEVVKRSFGGNREGRAQAAGPWRDGAGERLARLKRERQQTFGTTRA